MLHEITEVSNVASKSMQESSFCDDGPKSELMCTNYIVLLPFLLARLFAASLLSDRNWECIYHQLTEEWKATLIPTVLAVCIHLCHGSGKLQRRCSPPQRLGQVSVAMCCYVSCRYYNIQTYPQSCMVLCSILLCIILHTYQSQFMPIYGIQNHIS